MSQKGPQGPQGPRRGGRSASSLDVRNPLVVDTRTLGRRPGSLHEQTRTVPAPADLGLPLVGVPQGSDVVLDLRLESVVEGVLVTCTVSAQVAAECGRCLDPYVAPLDTSFTELYVYPERLAALGADAGEDELAVDGDLLDLEQPLRDAVVLDLPSSPPCFRDCTEEFLAERFAGHGVVLEQDGPLVDVVEDETEDEPLDPRWAALRRLQDGGA